MTHRRRCLVLVSLLSVSTCWAAKPDPVLESVANNCDGTYTAVFGYRTTGLGAKEIAIGPNNRFAGADSQNMGQPTSFERGEHKKAVTVRFAGDQVKWILDGDSAVALADSADNSCFWTVPQGAVTVAKRELPSLKSWLAKVIPGTDSSNVILGSPFRFYVSWPEHRSRFAKGDAIYRAIYTSEGGWLFPVWCGDEVVSRILISSDKGKWELNGNADYGLPDRELGVLRRSWPEDRGFHPFIVLCLSSKKITDRFFFSIPELGRHNLTQLVPEVADSVTSSPVKSQAGATKKYATISTLDETISNLTK